MYHLKSNYKSQYIEFLDQNQAQNTSLDSVTAHKSKLQPEPNLKSRYESKIGFKVMNWIKKIKKPNQKSKIGNKSNSKPQFGLGLATSLKKQV